MGIAGWLQEAETGRQPGLEETLSRGRLQCAPQAVSAHTCLSLWPCVLASSHSTLPVARRSSWDKAVCREGDGQGASGALNPSEQGTSCGHCGMPPSSPAGSRRPQPAALLGRTVTACIVNSSQASTRSCHLAPQLFFIFSGRVC